MRFELALYELLSGSNWPYIPWVNGMWSIFRDLVVYKYVPLIQLLPYLDGAPFFVFADMFAAAEHEED